MRKTSNLLLCGTPALLVAALAATPLHSAPRNGDPVTITGRSELGRAIERVSYADLNLAVERDQEQLFRRVRNASHRVCSPQALGVSVSDEDFSDCSRTARSEAKPKVELAIERARQIASTGTSSIPVVAIAIGAGA